MNLLPYILAFLFLLAVAVYLYIRIRQVRNETLQNIGTPALHQHDQARAQVSDSLASFATVMKQQVGVSVQDAIGAFSNFLEVMPELRLMKKSWHWHRVGINIHDLWVGAYWKFTELWADGSDDNTDKLTIYICPVPCVLISFQRVRTYDLVPRAKQLDRLCLTCGEAESTHKYTLCKGKY
jgi:hypothetical protein